MPQQLFNKSSGKIKVKSQIQIHHLMNIQIDQKKKNMPTDDYISKIVEQSSQTAARRDSKINFPVEFKKKHSRQASQQVEVPRSDKLSRMTSNSNLKHLLQTSPYQPNNAQKNESFSSHYLNSNSPKNSQPKFINSQLKDTNTLQHSKVKPRINSAQKLGPANLLEPSVKMSQNVSSDQLQSYSIQNTPFHPEQLRRLLAGQDSKQSNSAIIRQKESSLISGRVETLLQSELTKIMLRTSRLLNSYKAQIADGKKQKLQMQSYILELESQLSYYKALTGQPN